MTYFIAAIKARGYKLKEVAEEMGISPVVLSSRLHRHTDWQFSEVLRICKILNMSLDEFAVYFPLNGTQFVSRKAVSDRSQNLNTHQRL